MGGEALHLPSTSFCQPFSPKVTIVNFLMIPSEVKKAFEIEE
jgi:hypothetical protein